MFTGILREKEKYFMTLNGQKRCSQLSMHFVREGLLGRDKD